MNKPLGLAGTSVDETKKNCEFSKNEPKNWKKRNSVVKNTSFPSKSPGNFRIGSMWVPLVTGNI